MASSQDYEPLHYTTIQRNVPGSQMIMDTGISFGACVFGIVKTDENSYTYGHFQPGEIVTELQGLAAQDLEKKVTVYQGVIIGTAKQLYEEGIALNIKQIKRLFRKRDEAYSRY